MEIYKLTKTKNITFHWKRLDNYLELSYGNLGLLRLNYAKKPAKEVDTKYNKENSMELQINVRVGDRFSLKNF